MSNNNKNKRGKTQQNAGEKTRRMGRGFCKESVAACSDKVASPLTMSE
jgi:hypothetical protein